MVSLGVIRTNNNTEHILPSSAQGINESLITCGVKPSNIFATYVPGAFELPLTARFLAASKRVDVIICVGCLIKGDTMHFEYIAGEKLALFVEMIVSSTNILIFAIPLPIPIYGQPSDATAHGIMQVTSSI
jgi:6,7-dimethyl-8-ribityllumazine synthase